MRAWYCHGCNKLTFTRLFRPRWVEISTELGDLRRYAHYVDKQAYYGGVEFPTENFCGVVRTTRVLCIISRWLNGPR